MFLSAQKTFSRSRFHVFRISNIKNLFQTIKVMKKKKNYIWSHPKKITCWEAISNCNEKSFQTSNHLSIIALTIIGWVNMKDNTLLNFLKNEPNEGLLLRNFLNSIDKFNFSTEICVNWNLHFPLIYRICKKSKFHKRYCPNLWP